VAQNKYQKNADHVGKKNGTQKGDWQHYERKMSMLQGKIS